MVVLLYDCYDDDDYDDSTTRNEHTARCQIYMNFKESNVLYQCRISQWDHFDRNVKNILYVDSCGKIYYQIVITKQQIFNNNCNTCIWKCMFYGIVSRYYVYAIVVDHLFLLGEEMVLKS